MGEIKRSSALGAIALCLGYAGTAAAQDADAEDSAASGSNDIIVTARRVEERLQDVPISITVFDQEAISNRNIITASDLASYTPSLSVNQRWGPEKSSFAIRGFVQDQNTAPSVGVYFADVVAPRAYGGTTAGGNAPVGSLMDLQNVQVLKGPQGTLFGRNTTGGAVLLVPRKPADRLEGYVEGSIGDFGMRRAQGVLNVPLADTFKVRLAVDRNKRNGYMKNRSGIGPKDYNDVNYFAARLSILAELTPDLENYTIATYSNSFGHGYGLKLIDCNPSATTGAAAFNALPACDQIARQNARGDGPYDIDVNAPQAYTRLRTWGVFNTTTWKVSDSLTVKNIASYQEFREQFVNNLVSDNFISRFPAGHPFSSANGRPFQYIYSATPTGGYSAAQSTFTEELQFQGSTADGSFNWQAGGYFENANPIGFNRNPTGIFLHCTSAAEIAAEACAIPFPAGGSYSQNYAKYWYYGRGLYAQGTYKFTDRLSLTAGIRYTWDKVRAFGQQTRLAPQANGTKTRTCADTVRFFNGTPGVPLVVTSRDQCSDDRFLVKSAEPTWLINLDYRPIPNVMFYAKYSRGYRAGSINLVPVGVESWDPEKVDAYEIGAKTSFSGAVHGYFNIAGFYNDFTDQQIIAQAIPNVPGVTTSNPIINAGKSRIQGIEVDASATFLDSLKFDVGYTYLDTKLISLDVPPVPAGAPYSHFVPVAAAGGPLAYSPKHRLTLTGTYTLPLAEDVGEISLGVTYVHTAKQFITPNTLPEYRYVPASDIINLNVNWDNVVGHPFDLAFFVTNLTNETYRIFVSGSYLSAGFETAQYAPPRMWGVRLRYRFGE